MWFVTATKSFIFLVGFFFSVDGDRPTPREEDDRLRCGFFQGDWVLAQTPPPGGLTNNHHNVPALKTPVKILSHFLHIYGEFPLGLGVLLPQGGGNRLIFQKRSYCVVFAIVPHRGPTPLLKQTNQTHQPHRRQMR